MEEDSGAMHLKARNPTDHRQATSSWRRGLDQMLPHPSGGTSTADASIWTSGLRPGRQSISPMPPISGAL